MASAFIYDIQTSPDQLHFATSVDQRVVSVWNALTLQKLATVEPGFNGGADRIGLDPLNRRIYSGTWQDGVSCYDYAVNRLIWHRPDLIGIQKVDLSMAFPSSVFVALETPDYKVHEPGMVKGIVELDAATGDIKWRLNSGHLMFVHPSKPLIVVEDMYEKRVYLLDGKKEVIGSVPMTYFAVLDVAFSNSLIGLSEGKEGVRILNCDAEVVCAYKPPGREPNCLQISFTDHDTVAFGDNWDASYLVMVDIRSGRLIREHQLDVYPEMRFIENGKRFIDPWGLVYRTADGTVEATIEA